MKEECGELSGERQRRYRVIDADRTEDRTARTRARRQAGILVGTKDGKIREKDVGEVIRIREEEKEDVRRFLKEELSITEGNLFPDLQALIDEGREKVPFEAAIRRWMKKIARGEAEEILTEIEGIQEEQEPGSATRQATMYCRAVALGKMGRLNEAMEDMNQFFREAGHMAANQAAKRNRKILVSACKRNEPTYAQKRMNAVPFASLWEIEITPMRVGQVGRFGVIHWAEAGKKQRVRMGSGEIELPRKAR